MPTLLPLGQEVEELSLHPKMASSSHVGKTKSGEAMGTWEG